MVVEVETGEVEEVYPHWVYLTSFHALSENEHAMH